MKIKPIRKELLFIHHSSTDSKGKRIMLILDNTENIIFQQDLLDTQILKTIGLTKDDLNMCKDFFISG